MTDVCVPDANKFYSILLYFPKITAEVMIGVFTGHRPAVKAKVLGPTLK